MYININVATYVVINVYMFVCVFAMDAEISEPTLIKNSKSALLKL